MIPAMSISLRFLGALQLLALLGACGREESTAEPEPTLPSAEAAAQEEVAAADDLRLRTRREKRVEGKPEWLQAADLDGDGRPEAVVATHSPGALLVWRGSRAVQETVEVGDYPLRPAPFAGGLAVASRAERSLVLLDFERKGEARERWHLELPDVPMAICAGSLEETRGAELFVVTKAGLLLRVDGDGVIERQVLDDGLPRCALVVAPELGLVVGFQQSDSLRAFRPAEGGGLEEVGHRALGGPPRDLLGLDLDGDGERELLALSGDHDGWIFGLGEGGGLDAEPLQFGTTSIPLRLLPLEPDPDPRWSVLTAKSVACELWDFTGAPRRRLFSYAGQTPCDLLSLDLSLDDGGGGHPDFWIANRDAHVVSLLRLDEAGPVQPLKVSVGTFPNDLAAGDLDGDGLPELFVIDAKDQAISVLTRTAGELAPGFVVATDRSPRAVTCADVDGDGLEDLLWLERTHVGTRLELRLADGSGGLHRPAGFEPVSLGLGARDLVVERFDDGAPLVVAVDPEGRRLLWTRLEAREGEWGASAVGELALEGSPRSIVTLSARSVARGVALALQVAPDRSRVEVHVPRPDGAGSLRWQRLGRLELPGAALDLAAGDLDGDGVDDLVWLAAEREGAVAGRAQPILVREGELEAGAPQRTDLRPQRILLADLSGDGRGEVFVANLDSHNVNAWLNVPAASDDTGLGGRDLRRLDDVGAGVGCIALGAWDLDGDGDRDLVVVDSANDGVSLILNEAR